MKIIGLFLLALVGVAAPAASQTAAAGAPSVSRPVTGGRGQAFAALATIPQGYLEEERFLSGTATGYAKAGQWDVDGAWGVTPASTAPFTVRILIRRPADAKRFNGIVVVEWLNVTAQSEGAADFMQMQEEILRDGYAWVGVGAQAVGVNAPRTGLKAWDADRYASLSHPGDAYSYDIFSQAARVLRQPRGEDSLGGLRIRDVLATGRSQSAFRLVSYINAIHPSTRLFDGYFVHSRGSNAAGIGIPCVRRDQRFGRDVLRCRHIGEQL